MLAPAMHTEMWRNAATVREHRHAARARASTSSARHPASSRERLGPRPHVRARRDRSGSPALPCGPSDLRRPTHPHSAGGTREPLDPVRFIGNRSSGRQGVALAQAARRTRSRGHSRRRATSRSRSASGVTVVEHVSHDRSSCRDATVARRRTPTRSSWRPPSPTTGRAAVAEPRSRRTAGRPLAARSSSAIPTSCTALADRARRRARSSSASRPRPRTTATQLLALGPREGRAQGRRPPRRQQRRLDRGLRHDDQRRHRVSTRPVHGLRGHGRQAVGGRPYSRRAGLNRRRIRPRLHDGSRSS